MDRGVCHSIHLARRLRTPSVVVIILFLTMGLNTEQSINIRRSEHPRKQTSPTSDTASNTKIIPR